MKKLIALVAAVCSAAVVWAEQLDHWEITKSIMSDGEWSFEVSLRSTLVPGTDDVYDMYIISDKAVPDHLAALDFSKPINSTDKKYAIVDFAPWGGGFLSANAKERIEHLRLPAHGLGFRLAGFSDCVNLKSVTPFLPADCKLADQCFNGCVSLASPLVVTANNWGSGAQGIFAKTAIPSVDLTQSTLTAIGRVMFSECPALTTVKLPATVTTIDSPIGPFSGCTALTSVEFHSFPAGLNNGFRHTYGTLPACDALTEVHFYNCAPSESPAATVFANVANGKVLTTYLHDMTDEQLAAWGEYCAEGGTVSDTSTWKKSLAGNPTYLSRPLVPFSVKHISVAAGADAQIIAGVNGTFVLSRADDDALDGDLKINYKVTGGDAESDVDYEALSGVATIPAGSRTGIITVRPCYTGLVSEKSLTITLAEGDYELVEAEVTATIKIISAGIRTLSVRKLSDADMGTGEVGVFEISFGDGLTVANDFAVGYSRGGTAQPGVAFADLLTGTAVIPAGKGSVLLRVVPLDDRQSTGNSALTLTLQPGAYTLAEDFAEMTITHADSFGGWTVANGTVSDGTWTFGAEFTASKELTVKTVTVAPQVVTPLNFDKAVVDDEGNAYQIVTLKCGFVTSSYPYPGYEGFCEYVGELKLPEGLRRIDDNSLGQCPNMSGIVKIPSTVTYIGRYAFCNDKNITIEAKDFPREVTGLGNNSPFANVNIVGDLKLPSLKGELSVSAFGGCVNLTSVEIGPGLTGLNGSWQDGPFKGCTGITNIVFHSPSLTIGPGAVFFNCSSLEEIDLSCVKDIYAHNDVGENTHTNNVEYAPFRSCSKLRKVTFGNVNFLHHLALYSGTALEEVHFTGAPPEIMGVPYAKNPTKTVSGQTVYPTITTYISKKNLTLKNKAGKCWLDYAANGVIDHKHSTFAAEYIQYNNENPPQGKASEWYYMPDPSARPLLVTEKPGMMLIVR